MFPAVPILRVVVEPLTSLLRADFDPLLTTICPQASRLKSQYFSYIRAYLRLTQITDCEGRRPLIIQECLNEILDRLKNIRLAVDRLLNRWSFPAPQTVTELLDDSRESEFLAAINRRANESDVQHYVMMLEPSVMCKLSLESRREMVTEKQWIMELKHSAYLKIPHTDTVIVAGGRSDEQVDWAVAEIAMVHSVSLTTGEVNLLKSMRCARSQHAIIYLRENIYVFGGVKGGFSLNSAEKFATNGDLAKTKWETIEKEMCERRYQFTACAYFCKIYLVGGRCTSAECFDPYRQCFSLLSLTLKESSHCITVTDGDEIIVISQNLRTRWRAGTTDPEISAHKPWLHISESSPVLYKRVMYTVSEGAWVAFNVDRNVEVTPRLEVL